MRVVALVVLALAGVAHADGPSRGFWMGDLAADDHAELTVTGAGYRCEGCSVPWADLALADLAGQHRVADGLAVFGQVSLLYRSDDGSVDGGTDGFVGPLTIGLRQRVPVARPGLTVALVPSVTIPRGGGGGEASTSVQVAHLLRPDASLYPVRTGTARLVVEARWQPGRWWVAGAVGGAIEGPEAMDRALTARAVGAFGVDLTPSLTAVAEGALTLIHADDGDRCASCEDDGELSRRFVGAGLRGAWRGLLVAGHVGRGFVEDRDFYGAPRFTLRWPVALDLTVGARW